MTNKPDNLKALLLDYHLGQLSDEQAHEIAHLIETDPTVARDSHRIAAMFGRLNSYDVPEPPANLADTVLHRVEQYRETTLQLNQVIGASEGIAETDSGLDVGEERTGSRWWSIRELAGLAAAILIVVGLLVPGVHRVREMNQRQICSVNLAAIGQGVGSYAQDNGNALPFAGHIPSGSWLPVRQQQVRYAPNARHFLLLTKQGHVKSMKVFVCPSQPGGQATEDTNFVSQANFSYSGQNLGQQGMKITLNPRMPLLADRNPFIGDGQFRVGMQPNLNSNNHGRNVGQNVLFFDGSVAWKNRSAVGLRGDNIWLAGTKRQYQGNEEPQYITDAFLIP